MVCHILATDEYIILHKQRPVNLTHSIFAGLQPCGAKNQFQKIGEQVIQHSTFSIFCLALLTYSCACESANACAVTIIGNLFEMKFSIFPLPRCIQRSFIVKLFILGNLCYSNKQKSLLFGLFFCLCVYVCVYENIGVWLFTCNALKYVMLRR